MAQESSVQIVAKFRGERFIESDPNRISLIKIGEYVRTPLYEPSIRAMCLPLSEVRKNLQEEREVNKKLDEAWKAATKIFQARSTFFRSKFKGEEEYILALICFTLDEPFNVYLEFNRLCQELMTNMWFNFPYKSLFYLLIQAEMRLITIHDETSEKVLKTMKTLRQPITITSDLDYSIEEEDEGSSGSTSFVEEKESSSPDARKIHTNSPMKRNLVHRVFVGFAFPLSESEFQLRSLVAFTHIMPTTLDEVKLIRLLEEKNKPVTLVEIDQISWSARYIAPLSLFPVEKEVVIWPWVKFYVEERKMIRKNVEKIVLKPTSRSFVNTTADKV